MKPTLRVYPIIDSDDIIDRLRDNLTDQAYRPLPESRESLLSFVQAGTPTEPCMADLVASPLAVFEALVERWPSPGKRLQDDLKAAIKFWCSEHLQPKCPRSVKQDLKEALLIAFRAKATPKRERHLCILEKDRLFVDARNADMGLAVAKATGLPLKNTPAESTGLSFLDDEPENEEEIVAKWLSYVASGCDKHFIPIKGSTEDASFTADSAHATLATAHDEGMKKLQVMHGELVFDLDAEVIPKAMKPSVKMGGDPMADAEILVGDRDAAMSAIRSSVEAYLENPNGYTDKSRKEALRKLVPEVAAWVDSTGQVKLWEESGTVLYKTARIEVTSDEEETRERRVRAARKQRTL